LKAANLFYGLILLLALIVIYAFPTIQMGAYGISINIPNPLYWVIFDWSLCIVPSWWIIPSFAITLAWIILPIGLILFISGWW